MRLSLIVLCALLTGTSHAEVANSDLWSLYQEARQQDPRLQQAAAFSEAATQREAEAKGRLLPQLGLSHTFSRSQRDDDYTHDTYNGTSHALSLSQPLYDPGTWRGYQKYRELTQQQAFAEDDTHSQTALSIAELYFAILAAEDELALTESELKATQRNQQRIQALYRRQMAMLTDVLEADARVSALQTNILDADNDVQTSRDAMAERIGRPISEPLLRLTGKPDFQHLLRAETDWVASALRSNPALRSQAHGAEAATKAFREAKANHLPNVSLNLSAQRSDIGYEGTLAPDSSTLIATIGVQVPLFSGGSTTARSAALYAEKDAAAFDYERLKREIIRETRVAKLKVETGPQRILAAEQAQRAAAKSRQAAERAFELGALNAVDVLERIRDEFRARRDLLRSHYSYITNLLLLYHWSGTLSEEDLRNSSQLLTQVNTTISEISPSAPNAITSDKAQRPQKLSAAPHRMD